MQTITTAILQGSRLVINGYFEFPFRRRGQKISGDKYDYGYLYFMVQKQFFDNKILDLKTVLDSDDVILEPGLWHCVAE